MSLAEWWPWALLAAVGVTALVALLYRRPGLSPGWRALFVLLRGAVLALLALLFADLACRVQRSGETPAAAVVVDDSPSMSLADPTGRTRGEHAQELVEAIRAAHPELDWTVYGLGGLSVPDAAEAVRSLASSRPDLSVVVVVGDGGGAMPTEQSDYPFPVHAVAAGDASLFDVSLGEPRGPRLSLVGKASLFLVEVRLVGEGPGETVVRARAREVSGGRREVELNPVEVELSEGTAVAEFRFNPPAPGWWLVEFETPALVSEATPLNNVRRLLVNVRRGEMTALVVAGEPGPESAFLHRSLARLPGVESRLLYRRPGGDFSDADGKRQTPDVVSPDAFFLVDLVPEGNLLTGLNRRLAAGRGLAIVWGRPGLRVFPETLASVGLRTLFTLRHEGGLRLVEGQARVVESSGRLFDGLLAADLPALSTYAEGLRDTEGAALTLSNPAGRRIPGALLAASGPPRAVFLGRGWWRWAFLTRAGDDSPYDLFVAELFAYVSSPAADDRLIMTLDRRRAVTGQSV
ncbi:MAG TPA: hypothetical protein ENN88_04800, partial [Candidatus Coatesbacteria bacterium]|nr:hypothetical protein [Candidatus Coatesbacteria bacterium]